MKLLNCTLICSMFFFAGPVLYQADRGPGSREDPKRDLQDLENRWLQVENDPDALESILAPDFLHVIPVGIITKEEQLAFMRKHPAPRQNAEKHFEDMHIRVYENLGIVNGMVVEAGPGTNRKTLFTDVFVYRDGKWQAVNAQELPAASNSR